MNFFSLSDFCFFFLYIGSLTSVECGLLARVKLPFPMRYFQLPKKYIFLRSIVSCLATLNKFISKKLEETKTTKNCRFIDKFIHTILTILISIIAINKIYLIIKLSKHDHRPLVLKFLYHCILRRKIIHDGRALCN